MHAACFYSPCIRLIVISSNEARAQAEGTSRHTATDAACLTALQARRQQHAHLCHRQPQYNDMQSAAAPVRGGGSVPRAAGHPIWATPGDAGACTVRHGLASEFKCDCEPQ